jgi:dihydropteroate synthase
MGILNVTPDSFSDGGRFLDPATAVAHAHRMVEAGADVVDIGGESSRPGSAPVSESVELQRVLPVVEQLPGVLISVDTTKAVVADRALAAGARIVNDISALQDDPRMIEVVRAAHAGLVVMHRQGKPATMQAHPHYGDVVREVTEFLAERIAWATTHGLDQSQIAVDPGIGFGKTAGHNLQLLAGIPQLCRLGCAVVIGASRKSFLGHTLGRASHERLAGSIAAATWAFAHGATVVRAHDVAETRDAARLVAALRAAGS